MATIEEKAKAYDDVVEKLSKLYRDYDSVSNLIDVKEELENILPELKENEDEKVRKWLIGYLENRILNCSLIDEKENCKTAIAWLEKQGKNNMGISEATKQKLEDSLNKALEKETPESWNKFLDEQKPDDTEKGAKGNEREIPNSAWSEKDEIALGDALWCCKKAVSLAKDENDLGNIWYAENWLESLKERYSWKPSDEQIKVCKEVYADILSAKGFDLGTVNGELNRLEEELKKLREE